MTAAPQTRQLSPEFSYVIDLGDPGKAARTYRLSADEEQRRRIAKRLKILSVEKLEGELRVAVTKRLIQIEGAVVATLERECVASLEPMIEPVNEAFAIDFLRMSAQGPGREETGPADEDFWDSPEIHESDQMDLGELLVQQLSLAMSQFPRKDGAPSLLETYGPSESASPFAELRGFLGKTDDNQ